MIDLEKRADEAEQAFIEASRNLKVPMYRVKELLGDYLHVLRLMRLKHDVFGDMLSLLPFQNALEQPHNRIVGG